MAHFNYAAAGSTYPPVANPAPSPHPPVDNPTVMPNYAAYQSSYPPVGYPAPMPHNPSQSSYQPPVANPAPVVPTAYPVAIIGPQYCLPYPFDLSIVRKVVTLTDDFVVRDLNDNFLFKVKGKFLALHDKRVLLDAAEKPIVTLRQKIRTMHSRWQVFRGESTEPKDLIFSAKTSSVFQLRTKLDVFLANNTSDETVCDFKVKGSWLERSCVVYAGETNNIVAQMHKKFTAQSILIGKDKFTVTVYPNIDYAFIVSLIVILDAINSQNDDH